MSDQERYLKVIEGMPEEELARQVLTVLLNHVGGEARVSRRELVFRLYGYVPKNFQNSSEDRQVRYAIAELQNIWHVPVLSDSSRGGYWIGTEEEIARTVAEWKSRAVKLFEKARAVEGAFLNEPVGARQLEMFG